MLRTVSLVFIGFLSLAPGLAQAGDNPSATVLEGGLSDRLTLTEARQIVSHGLAESRQRQLRPAKAEFVDNGDVLVDVVNIQGLVVRQFVVDGKTRQLAAAPTRGAARG